MNPYDVEAERGRGWFYSDTVKEHFFNPRNLLPSKEAKNYKADGFGQVGSPACGDVLGMWIKVDKKKDKIVDCKWETFGCLLGNTKIMTPNGRRRIKDLEFGDWVWSWDGHGVVKAKVLGVVEREVNKEDIVKILFKRKKGSNPYKMFSTKDHLFFIKGQWLKASELKNGDELFHLSEKEWRSLNIVGRKNWLRKVNALRLKNNNPMFDPEMVRKNREAQHIRPTKIEQIIIDLIESNNLPVRYVGDGKFWVTDKTTKRCKNPDFKVNYQRKLIEIYFSNYPWQNRDEKWVEERKNFFKKQGFDVLFLDMAKNIDFLEKVQNFIHNGEKIFEIRDISKREYGQIKENNGKVKVYDLQLTPPHTFFSWRILSHNCASAIASTSVLSVIVTENGGMNLDDALKLTPKDILQRLSGLPARKIHCSVLGDKALREAINDYFRKTKQYDRIKIEGAKVIDKYLKITDKDIEEAVLEGARTFEDVQKRTKVGVYDKNCIPEVKRLMEEFKEKHFGHLKDG